MSNAKQTWMAERIDRSREAPKVKADRTARAMYIRMEARKLITRAANDFDGKERAMLLCDVLDIVAEQLHPIIGRVEAATAFNSRATDICGPLKLNRAIAVARAEQLFTRAANDEGRT
jgi:hypothetical protein